MTKMYKTQFEQQLYILVQIYIIYIHTVHTRGQCMKGFETEGSEWRDDQ